MVSCLNCVTRALSYAVLHRRPTSGEEKSELHHRPRNKNEWLSDQKVPSEPFLVGPRILHSASNRNPFKRKAFGRVATVAGAAHGPRVHRLCGRLGRQLGVVANMLGSVHFIADSQGTHKSSIRSCFFWLKKLGVQ